MRLRRARDRAPYLVVMLLLAGQAARAQTAEDFFDGGAQFYTLSNNIPAALARTEQGLKLYPDNVKLKKLEELLKQKQKQQSQSQQSRNQQQSQRQNSGSRKNQSQQNQRRQNQQKQNQAQQRQQRTQPSSGNSNKKKSQGEKTQTEGAGKMTPQAAKKLLNSQKGAEQFLQLKPPAQPQNQRQPAEDW